MRTGKFIRILLAMILIFGFITVQASADEIEDASLPEEKAAEAEAENQLEASLEEPETGNDAEAESQLEASLKEPEPGNEAEENEAVLEASAAYNIWVGSTQVTDDNKDAIPGAKSGTASYDPGTNTLTLQNVRSIDGTHEGAMIYCKDSMTLRLTGINLMMNSTTGNGNVKGIRCEAKLTITGSGYLTMIMTSQYQGTVHGVSCSELSIEGGTIEVTASSTVNGYNCFGLDIYKLTILNGSLLASGTTKCVGYLYHNYELELADGYNIIASNEGGNAWENTTKEGFVANSAENNPNTVYKYVKIAKTDFPTYYPVWIGGNQVTSKNKDSLPGITGGSGSYDPDTATLTLSNAQGVDGLHQNALLSSRIDLTLKLEGTSSLTRTALTNSPVYGYWSYGVPDTDGYNTTLTVTGTGSLTISVSGGVPESCGICCWKLVMDGGTLHASSSDTTDLSYGLKLGMLELKNGTLSASGSTACESGVSIDSKLIIPGEYEITAGRKADGSDAQMVSDTDFLANITAWDVGGSLYRYVKFTKGYDIWVGSTHVTDKNKNDIPGVKSGKASYDPETDTLTLSDVKGVEGNYHGNMLFSGSSMTLKLVGSSELSGTQPTAGMWRGIYCRGKLTITGSGSLWIDVDGEVPGNVYGISTTDMVMNGGTVSVYATHMDSDTDSTGLNIYYLEINGGRLIASGSTKCISYVNADWELKLADGYNIVAGTEERGTEHINVTREEFLANMIENDVGGGVFRFVHFTNFSVPTYYPVWVGGYQVTDQSKDSVSGISGGRGSYDPETATLTLENVKKINETQIHNNALISSKIDLTLKLIGENEVTLTTTSGSGPLHGYYSWGIPNSDGYNTTLTVTGPGSLSINLTGYNRDVDGVNCSKLVMESGTFSVSATANGLESRGFGLNVSGLELNGGKLTASGSTACESGVKSNFPMADGYVIVAGREADGSGAAEVSKTDFITNIVNWDTYNTLFRYVRFTPPVILLEITKHPESVTVAAGTEAAFSVEAKGLGLTYQWQMQEKNSSAWTNLTGETAAALTVTATAEWDGRKVRCVVKDANGGTLNSNAASVSIKAADPVALKGISFKETSLEIPATTGRKLEVVYSPADASNKKVSWNSSNTKIATVDAEGNVTGKVTGRVKITAISEDGGYTATCNVWVLFRDVTDKKKANFNAIYYLVDKGVIAGFKSGEFFAPNDQCTRAQVVLFLWRAAGKPDPKSTDLKFSDADEIRKLAPDYTKAIAWGNENGIVMGFTSGANKGKFMPNDPCTRAQIVLFLYRYAKKPTVTNTELTFADAEEIRKLAPDYTKAILWAVGKGLTTGYGDGTFRPNQTCTRGECATFIYRMVK